MSLFILPSALSANDIALLEADGECLIRRMRLLYTCGGDGYRLAEEDRARWIVQGDEAKSQVSGGAAG